jgi:hypothetical protein
MPVGMERGGDSGLSGRHGRECHNVRMTSELRFATNLLSSLLALCGHWRSGMRKKGGVARTLSLGNPSRFLLTCR